MTEYIPLHLHPLRCHLWPAENKMARMKQRWKPTVGSVRSARLKMTPNRPNPRRSKVEAKVKAKVEAKVRVFQMDHPQQRRAQWNDLPLAVGLWPLRRSRLPPKPHPSPGLLKPRRLPSPNPERKPRSRKRVNQRKRELGGEMDSNRGGSTFVEIPSRPPSLQWKHRREGQSAVFISVPLFQVVPASVPFPQCQWRILCWLCGMCKASSWEIPIRGKCP